MARVLSLPPRCRNAPSAEVLDSHGAAELLHVHLSTVQELAREGKLPGRKVGKDYRFLRSALLAWLAQVMPGSTAARSRP